MKKEKNHNIQEQAYGVVVFFFDGIDWLTPLVYANGYWGLPKGHAEQNETPEETAYRELKEETGISINTHIPEVTFSTSYYIKSIQVDKTVTFFVVEIGKKHELTPSLEVVEARWFKISEALDYLKYQDFKEILVNAQASLLKYRSI